MAARKKKAPRDLAAHHRQRLARLCPRAPFVLRITAWKKYPAPLFVVSERSYHEDRTRAVEWGKAARDSDSSFDSKGVLRERGHLSGEGLSRIRPVLREVLKAVTDDAGVPLGLEQYAGKDAAKFRGNLPLDDEAGCKLSLIFKLSERVSDLDRVELIALRVERFTREEAAYWLSRTLHFGPDAGRWALAGMKLLLGGESGDPAVAEMVNRLKSS